MTTVYRYLSANFLLLLGRLAYAHAGVRLVRITGEKIRVTFDAVVFPYMDFVSFLFASPSLPKFSYECRLSCPSSMKYGYSTSIAQRIHVHQNSTSTVPSKSLRCTSTHHPCYSPLTTSQTLQLVQEYRPLDNCHAPPQRLGFHLPVPCVFTQPYDRAQVVDALDAKLMQNRRDMQQRWIAR